MYVNIASVTNTFSAMGTQIGAKNHYVYFFEKLFGSTTVFNRAVLQDRSYEATELASSLQTASNAASWFGDDLYTCQYNESRQNIEISRPADGSRTFFIPSNDLMENPAFQAQTVPLHSWISAIHRKLVQSSKCPRSARARQRYDIKFGYASATTAPGRSTLLRSSNRLR